MCDVRSKAEVSLLRHHDDRDGSQEVWVCKMTCLEGRSCEHFVYPETKEEYGCLCDKRGEGAVEQACAIHFIASRSNFDVYKTAR